MAERIWYVLEACMLTSESQVSLFRTAQEATKDFKERKAELIKEMGQSTYDELKDNRDFINEGDEIFWVEGSLLDGKSDIYLELGYQVI